MDNQEMASSLIAHAKHFLDEKRKEGAYSSFRSRKLDCSSFTQHIYAKCGIKLPRKARDQAECGLLVDKENLQQGDLLFFFVPERFPSNDIPGHVGIYMGDGEMIHCLPPPRRILVSKLNTPYKEKTFLFAKRVISADFSSAKSLN